MAKTKVLPKIEPGSEIKVHCRNKDQGCTEYFLLQPSSAKALPSEFKFVCAGCAGMLTKWQMPKEKAEKVSAKAPGQKTLADATVQEFDD